MRSMRASDVLRTRCGCVTATRTRAAATCEVPYHDLLPYPGAPMTINGYLTTIIIAMIPPLWHKLMTAKVPAWDCDFATDEERSLAASANARSGIPTLRRAGQSH